MSKLLKTPELKRTKSLHPPALKTQMSQSQLYQSDQESTDSSSSQSGGEKTVVYPPSDSHPQSDSASDSESAVLPRRIASTSTTGSALPPPSGSAQPSIASILHSNPADTLDSESGEPTKPSTATAPRSALFGHPGFFYFCFNPNCIWCVNNRN